MTSSETVPLKGGAMEDPRLKGYRAFVYFMTFVAYAMSHFSRKSYTNVKKQMKTDAGMTTELFSRMDTGFMFAYAIGSFFSGQLGDRLRPTTVVAAGLIGSAACVMALVFGLWGDVVHENPIWANTYFLSAWLLHGLFQSTGGPVNTAIMGAWFDSKNRGLVFGTWTCHQYMGNIIAAITATAILAQGFAYWWVLVISAVANLAWGVFLLMALPSRPAEVGIEFGDAPKVAVGEVVNKDTKQLPPISFVQAFQIPAVAMYALAFGFFKLVNYVLFFWLPFFLTRTFTPSQSNVISTLYDVGMMPGGIIVGYVSDLYGGRRACVIVTFLLLLCPLLYVFSQYSDVIPVYALLVLLGFMGILVGGPNNIISSAVAADLADHPSIQGNNRAIGTVTGIINGSGSVTAAIGLLFIGDIQAAWGWSAVWYLLILSTLLGCSLLAKTVYR
ncbi:major facilitator superfamily domain-containing protein [Tribonema minus]|uniref:Major facilitator superfamily domain-containing protein n=1 Tax=Tribonema minus TaxID=303371 RepID=A0A835YZT8_9STRA|nr:major facilitator superfamily domain-containing protein [Tribonema minus]